MTTWLQLELVRTIKTTLELEFIGKKQVSESYLKRQVRVFSSYDDQGGSKKGDSKSSDDDVGKNDEKGSVEMEMEMKRKREILVAGNIALVREWLTHALEEKEGMKEGEIKVLFSIWSDFHESYLKEMIVENEGKSSNSIRYKEEVFSLLNKAREEEKDMRDKGKEKGKTENEVENEVEDARYELQEKIEDMTIN